LWAEWAISSATVRSISWPIPVTTGKGDAAMARATDSVSKAARSVRAPPPRTNSTTSAPRSTATRSAATIERSASAPWVRVSTTVTRNPRPERRSSSNASACAALLMLVTSAMCMGTCGRRAAALAPMSPSAVNSASTRSRSWPMTPNV
jgi:hypothetical protein